MSEEPVHGWTKLGHAVHASVLDHMPDHNAYARFNKKVALALTKYVMTMTTFWVFSILALLSLPAVLSGFHAFHGVFPSWAIRTSIIALIAWVCQTYIQLVLLPALGVGQNLQNIASDARAAKTFEDVEYVKDQVNEHTDGGIRTILDRLNSIEEKMTPPPPPVAVRTRRVR